MVHFKNGNKTSLKEELYAQMLLRMIDNNVVEVWLTGARSISIHTHTHTQKIMFNFLHSQER